jgi:xanthine dehydrogenase accessory factor
MRAELLGRAADLAARHQPFVLAVVVWRRPPSSAQAGDMALVTADGRFEGWLGGACTQPTVVREAQAALADGRPRLVALAPEPESLRRPGVDVFPMTCHSGGSVEIYLEPVLPAPRLAVFGVSPAARALARLGRAMGYSVVAVGPAADAGLFPDAEQVFGDVASALASAAAGRETWAVVAAMGEGDEEAVEAALRLAPAYLGVVASSRRFAEIRRTLAARGVPEAALDGVRSPAGLDLGARTAEEIALSVLAEIVQRRRRSPAGGEAGERAAAAPPASAIDPICGMTVEIATARHRAEHQGKSYYFCCAGCRQQFLAAPQRWIPAAPEPHEGGAA